MLDERSSVDMEIFAKPVKTVITISDDKAKAFLSHKADPKVKARILRQAKRVSEHTTFSKR